MEVDSVYVILYTKEERVLMIQREEGTVFSGYWTLPGGKVDAGETPDQAIRREMTEEITLSPEVTFWNIHRHPHFQQINGQDVIIRQHVYFAVIEGNAGQVKLGEGGQDVRFFTLDEIQQIPVAFGMTVIVEQFFEARRL
jgi:mutator protein MutT